MPSAAKNALDLLMMSRRHQGGPKKRRLSGSSTKRSSFVACPAGCGKHLPNWDYQINQHLDRDCASRWSVAGVGSTTNIDPADTTTKDKHPTQEDIVEIMDDGDDDDDDDDDGPGRLGDSEPMTLDHGDISTTAKTSPSKPSSPRGSSEDKQRDAVIKDKQQKLLVPNEDAIAATVGKETAAAGAESHAVRSTEQNGTTNTETVHVTDSLAVEEISKSGPGETKASVAPWSLSIPAPGNKASPGVTTTTTTTRSNATQDESTIVHRSVSSSGICTIDSPAISAPVEAERVTREPVSADTRTTDDPAEGSPTPAKEKVSKLPTPETPKLSRQDTLALLAKDMEILREATGKESSSAPPAKRLSEPGSIADALVTESPGIDTAKDCTATALPAMDTVSNRKPDDPAPVTKKISSEDPATSNGAPATIATNESAEETTNQKNPYTAVPKHTPQTNVFAHMMKQSSQVFNDSNNTNRRSKTVAADFFQHFVLEYDTDQDSVSIDLIETSSPDGDDKMWKPSLWTTAVNVKDKHCADAPKTVGLTLLAVLSPSANHARLTTTTTTANAQLQSHRWVRYHSRLSVPVLKSMLQKSIRRRRPLPAVRVAMELMDKAFGELLRRLPIIILEDSTLHPDFGLLVWMMVAHSKHFFDVKSPESADPYNREVAESMPIRRKLILTLQVRVLRIVYQVASCPYQDHLVPEKQKEESLTPQPCISKPYPKSLSQLSECEDKSKKLSVEDESAKEPSAPLKTQQKVEFQHFLQLSVWAMLVRAQYGGMACDVHMLLGFAQVWHERLYVDNCHPKDDSRGKEYKLSPTFPITVQHWSQLVPHIQAAGKEQSINRIPSASVALEKLNLTDICREGIDFHCSNLLDYLCKNASLVRACQELGGGSPHTKSATTDADAQLLLKRCIWKYSAGVNFRRSLVELSKASVEDSMANALKSFWNDVAAPLVLEYQTKYLKDRLQHA